MLMAIATPPQRMGPGVEEHELIGVVVLRWLARAFEELVGWEDAGLFPFLDVGVDFCIDKLPHVTADAFVLRRELHRYLPANGHRVRQAQPEALAARACALDAIIHMRATPNVLALSTRASASRQIDKHSRLRTRRAYPSG